MFKIMKGLAVVKWGNGLKLATTRRGSGRRNDFAFFCWRKT